MEATKKVTKKSAIEVKVLAVNILNQYAKKYTEYERDYFAQFIGKNILKVNGSLKAKYEHEPLTDSGLLPDGTHFQAHYWFKYAWNSFDMVVKICVHGGSYDDKSYFCQYEETTYTLFDTDETGNMKATERYNNDYNKQYDAATLVKQANEVIALAAQYEAAERSIPHYFRGVLNVQRLSHN